MESRLAGLIPEARLLGSFFLKGRRSYLNQKHMIDAHAKLYAWISFLQFSDLHVQSGPTSITKPQVLPVFVTIIDQCL